MEFSEPKEVAKPPFIKEEDWSGASSGNSTPASAESKMSYHDVPKEHLA